MKYINILWLCFSFATNPFIKMDFTVIGFYTALYNNFFIVSNFAASRNPFLLL